MPTVSFRRQRILPSSPRAKSPARVDLKEHCPPRSKYTAHNEPSVRSILSGERAFFT
ncbi:uncharacterized protein PHACADRAFT_196913 [Phanerochaete carnosa HHB-10118-sp]|uniref:Uncharacterized protein n=1 Tax=Phanerochaete carnosa (strain HHB-10118-sp) TaxID=650164 RepID=K5W6A9_PHACS|nr:uncharacterized protein PHACADRAFT_196913 [Phanerochaete carnosa HHB-10118-sp]EKM54484.1 hypothetical protein PHACADRAFT_196913 [Phanerochaete carnosa HHB-10118-sp]